MSFRKDLEEIKKKKEELVHTFFKGCEMLTLLWETKAEIIERILPPPLEPVSRPIVIAFIVNYPSTNQGLPYREGALMLRSQFEGQMGNYYLAMPVTDDRAMIGGREIFGFPKKMANVILERNGDDVYGYSERLGVKNIEVKAKLTGEFNDPETPKIIGELGLLPGRKKNTINYNFKYFPAPNKVGFDYNPWLVRQETKLGVKSMEMGEVEIILGSTPHDPWAEVEVVKTLGCLYLKGDNTMFPGQKIAEVNPEEYLPYAYNKWDWY